MAVGVGFREAVAARVHREGPRVVPAATIATRALYAGHRGAARERGVSISGRVPSRVGQHGYAGCWILYCDRIRPAGANGGKPARSGVVGMRFEDFTLTIAYAGIL